MIPCPECSSGLWPHINCSISLSQKVFLLCFPRTKEKQNNVWLNLRIFVMFLDHMEQYSEVTTSSELRNQAWLCSWDPYRMHRIKTWSVTCKANILLCVLSLQLQEIKFLNHYRWFNFLSFIYNWVMPDLLKGHSWGYSWDTFKASSLTTLSFIHFSFKMFLLLKSGECECEEWWMWGKCRRAFVLLGASLYTSLPLGFNMDFLVTVSSRLTIYSFASL